MPLADLVELAQRALVLAALVSLPVLAMAAIVGLVMAVLQAATQVQDPALSHLPKFLAVCLVLVSVGPWMGHKLVAFFAYALGAR